MPRYFVYTKLVIFSIVPTIDRSLLYPKSSSGVFNSLSQYLDRFNLISPDQSGFRKNHNCETALLTISQDWYDCLSNKEIFGLVSLDFRKAFDFVNPCILLKKLVLYKLTPKTLDWFTCYLTDRIQSILYTYSFKSQNYPKWCSTKLYIRSITLPNIYQ